jgi:hypothetical protein
VPIQHNSQQKNPGSRHRRSANDQEHVENFPPVHWLRRYVVSAQSTLIRKLERYEDAVPNQQGPVVKARSDFRIHNMLKTVTEHRLIVSVRIVIRQLYKQFEMLWRLEILARVKRPPDCAVLGPNLVAVMKIQPSNDLPKYAFNTF